MFLSYNAEQFDIIVELDHFHSIRKHLKFRHKFYISIFILFYFIYLINNQNNAYPIS